MITSKIAPYEKKMERGAQSLREEEAGERRGGEGEHVTPPASFALRLTISQSMEAPSLPPSLIPCFLPSPPPLPSFLPLSESFEYNALIKLSSLPLPACLPRRAAASAALLCARSSLPAAACLPDVSQMYVIRYEQGGREDDTTR